MSCMVKLNNLENMVEPSLEGAPIALPSALRQDKAMDLEAEAGRWEGANNAAQFSPEDENFGPV